MCGESSGIRAEDEVVHIKWCLSNLVSFFPSCLLSHLLSKRQQKQLNCRCTVPETSEGTGWWPQAGRGRRSPDTRGCGWAASVCGCSAGIAACTSPQSDKRKTWAVCVDRSQVTTSSYFWICSKNIMLRFRGAICHNYWAGEHISICDVGLMSHTVDILF